MSPRPPSPLPQGPRVDGWGRVSGAAVYTGDLHLPGALHGELLRSPHPHALIRSIRTSRARALPGVRCVLTGADLPNAYGIIPVSRDEHALAVDRVRFVGDAVAAVAAVDRQAAQEALAAIEVEYEPLPAVLRTEDALTDQVLLHPDRGTNVLSWVDQDFGDVDAALGASHLVLDERWAYDASTHAALEPHAVVASWDPAGTLTVYSSTQVPHYLQGELSRVLGLPTGQIRVIKPYVGGAFGGKSEAFSHELCAALMARRTGRPVKCVVSREEVFALHRGRHAATMRLRTGHTREGHLTAIELTAVLDTGAYASFGVVTSYYVGALLTLPYHLPAYRSRVVSVYTNTPPAGPKRGHGAVQPRMALECQIDMAAARLGLDPAELRLGMLVPEGHHTVNGLKVGSIGLRRAIEAVVEASGWRERRASLPPGVGLGLACSVYICGAAHPIYGGELPHSTAVLRIDRTGRVVVACGTAEIGQGSTSLLARIAAAVLGRPVAEIAVVEGDTDLCPVDLGSYSSRVTFMAGNAVRDAALRLRGRLLEVAAEALGASEGELTLDAQGAQGGEGRRLGWLELVGRAERAGGPLVATGTYTPPWLGGTFTGTRVGPSPAYSFTAQVAQVRVDPQTGEAHPEHLWCAHDCGRALDEQSVMGQIEGCVAMGLGEALYESMDLSAGGQVINPSLLDYLLPTTLDTPPITAIPIESHDPGGPFGAKEVGEGPQLSTVPAVLNAIAAASGARVHQVPASPDRVWAALRGRGKVLRLPELRPSPEREALRARMRARAQRRQREG